MHQVAKVLELQLQHQSFSEYSGLISFRIDCFVFIKVTDLMITASEGIYFGPFGPGTVVLTALHGCSLRDQSGLRVRTWFSPAFLASPAPHLTQGVLGIGSSEFTLLSSQQDRSCVLTTCPHRAQSPHTQEVPWIELHCFLVFT